MSDELDRLARTAAPEVLAGTLPAQAPDPGPVTEQAQQQQQGFRC